MNCLSGVLNVHPPKSVTCQIVVMHHIACWFRRSAVLKFDQFYHSSFF